MDTGDLVFKDSTLDPACQGTCECGRSCDRREGHPGRCICPVCWTNRKGPL